MVAARDGRSRQRAGVLFSTAAMMVCVLLGGCIGEPDPAPVQPSPPMTVVPSPPPATTAVAPPSSSLRALKAMLELYAGELLREGAPAVLMEAKVGQEEWSYSAGVRSRDGGVPATPGDPVQVGGITQTMVAVSVLKLVDDGRQALNDTITKYLPELDGTCTRPGPFQCATPGPHIRDARFLSRPVGVEYGFWREYLADDEAKVLCNEHLIPALCRIRRCIDGLRRGRSVMGQT